MTEIRAELRANVWKICMAIGDHVSTGDELVILESMKTEIPVESPAAGTVTSLHVTEGDTVDVDDVMVTIDSAT